MRISDWSSDVCCSDLKAHWHVLLRARAIETGCYVVAPAQCGEHAGGRLTYGHPLIVDPWGAVLADGQTGRASWRARGCQCVALSVVAVSCKKQDTVEDKT